MTPASSKAEFNCSARNTPGIVPTSISIPNLRSTWPRCLCLSVLIIDEPMIRAKPVPTANTGGTPKTSSPPVMRNPPPTPKNPLNVPTITPNSSKSAGLTVTSALGNHMLGVTPIVIAPVATQEVNYSEDTGPRKMKDDCRSTNRPND